MKPDDDDDIDHDKSSRKGEKYSIGKQHGHIYINISPNMSLLKP